MIDAATVEEYMRDANPIPTLDAIDADEFAHFVATTRVRRAAVMQAPTQHPTPTNTPPTAPPPHHHRAWAFAATFVLILLVVGGAALFLRSNDPPVADETAARVDSPDPATVVPDLETLTWTKVDFSTEELREHYGGVLVFDPDHGFWLWHSQGLWKSDDGMSWTFVDVPTEFADYTVVNLVGQSENPVGLGLGTSDAGSYVLLSWHDDAWVEVGQLEMPDTVGMHWSLELAAPIESDGVLLAPGRLRGGLPWGEIYGRFKRPDCTECEEWPPKAKWDESSQTLRIVHPFDDSALASLRIEVAGDTATFRDADTGDAVHEVVGSAEYPIGWLLDKIFTPHATQWRYNITSEQIWAGMPGTDFEFHDPPPSERPIVLAAPDGSGFVAYEVERDPAPAGSPRYGLVTGLRTWTSADAITWSEATAPPFPQPWAWSVDVNSGVGEIYAIVDGSVPDDQEGAAQFWVSSDGVTWDQKVLPPDYQDSTLFGPYPTEFGYVAWSRWSGEDDPLYWMSLDGESWIEVAMPAGSHGWSAVAGSTLFWANGTDDGDALWVGRFEPRS